VIVFSYEELLDFRIQACRMLMNASAVGSLL